MKHKFLIVFCFLFLTIQTIKQKTEPRTVTDFYNLLPGYREQTIAERRANIVIEDVANGCLRLKPSAEQDANDYAEIAIFKRATGGYVVAWNAIDYDDEN